MTACFIQCMYSPSILFPCLAQGLPYGGNPSLVPKTDLQFERAEKREELLSHLLCNLLQLKVPGVPSVTRACENNVGAPMSKE